MSAEMITENPVFVWDVMPTRLQEEIRKELANARLSKRKHPSRATYAIGCLGPLCKAERDRAQQRREDKAKAEGRELRKKERDPDTVTEDLMLDAFVRAFFGDGDTD